MSEKSDKKSKFFFSEDNKKEEIKEEVKEEKKEETVSSKKVSSFYLSFRLRVILLITGIILLFTIASFMIIWSLRNNEIVKINYNESTKVNYDVCYKDDKKQNEECLPENRSYSKNKTSIIHTKFEYLALFEEEIDYQLSYYIVLVNRIYDPFDSNKVYYEDESNIVELTPIKGDLNKALLDVSINTDYQKYNSFVEDYKNKYSVDADSAIDIILYINDGVDTRNVSRISIPLGEESFEIHTDTLSKEKRIYSHTIGEWTNLHTILVVVGSILIVLSLLLLSYLTKLVLKITVKKSKYQQKLSSILNDYNHYIVNSEGDYKIDSKKRIIKVSSFEELLDARGILNKPIVYNKINNIKAEFIVEDSDIIYRYILKEADMEE